jgi:hypothetical protein
MRCTREFRILGYSGVPTIHVVLSMLVLVYSLFLTLPIGNTQEIDSRIDGQNPASEVARTGIRPTVETGPSTPSSEFDFMSSSPYSSRDVSIGFAPSTRANMDWPQFNMSETDAKSKGLNFNEFPKDFNNGLTIRQSRWGMKLGGYVKADLLYDFNAIDSTDFFDPSMIAINEPKRTNARLHARQTRLNLDSRWITDSGEPLRVLVEGDFFGVGDTLRLRHAYGEYQGLLIGQTWSTLTHRAALPNTLDLVGDVASVGRRQPQVRWTKSLDNHFSFSAAIEDSRILIDESLASIGQSRPVAPDFVSRLRFTTDDSQLQLASVVRRIGFQPSGQDLIAVTGAGLNATGYTDLTSDFRVYGGVLWGSGIGNYRDLPDIALTSSTSGKALQSLSWYTGVHHQWSKAWSSNFTYSRGNVNNTLQQSTDSVQGLQYLATNLIWQPTPYTFSGIEYLWGTRRNRSQDEADANRIMVSFGFLFP